MSVVSLECDYVVEQASELADQLCVARSWYAIRVRPRWEKRVSSALQGKGYEEFLPLYRKRAQWSDRTKDVDWPLFPGYVFCRELPSGRPPVVTTPGVLGILTFGNELALVSESEILAIKAVLRSGAAVEPWPYLREGQRCRIRHGVLSNLEGILLQKRKDCRVVLSVDALGQSVAVEIDQEWIEPIYPERVRFGSAELVADY